MDDEPDFIRTIVASPGDDGPRLAFADWLLERGDPRGDYLQAERSWARSRDPAEEEALRAMAGTLDPVWVARVSRPPLGVCADQIRFIEPRGDDEPRPRATEADLAWIESRFALTLPADYRAFLMDTNGGRLEPNGIRLDGREYVGFPPSEMLLGLDSFWEAAEPEVDADDDLVWHLNHLEEVRSEAWFAFMRQRWSRRPHRDLMIVGYAPPTGELEWFCLGCRGKAFGRVFMVSPTVGDFEGQRDLEPVAPSFAAMLAMVKDHDPDHIRAAKHGDVATLLAWLDAGGDPNTAFGGNTLLGIAIRRSQADAVRLLIARGATVYDGFVSMAEQAGAPAVIALIREALARPASDA